MTRSTARGITAEYLERIGATSGNVYKRLTHLAAFGEPRERNLAIFYLGSLKYRRATGLISRLLYVAEEVGGINQLSSDRILLRSAREI